MHGPLSLFLLYNIDAFYLSGEVLHWLKNNKATMMIQLKF